MKISSLLIENFRGITRVKAENLGDTVIIAGQNGSGKSCIFDAIRLHGGAKYLLGLFNDLSKPVIIEAI